MIDAMNGPIPNTKRCDKIDADDEVHMIPMTPKSKLAKYVCQGLYTWMLC